MPDLAAEHSPLSLQAILLVTRTRAGPRILLCCPPTPGQDNAASIHNRQAQHQKPDDDLSLSRRSSADSKAVKHPQQDATSEHNGTSAFTRSLTISSNKVDNDSDTQDSSQLSRRPSTARETPSRAASPPLAVPRPATATASAATSADSPSAPTFSNSTHLVPDHISPSRAQQTWKEVLGFPADSLARMLAPTGRTWHKRRLELQLRDLCFVGCPIYERKEGGWGKIKKESKNADDDIAGNEHQNVTGNGAEGDIVDDMPHRAASRSTIDSSPDEDGTSVSATRIPDAPSSQKKPDAPLAASFATSSSSYPSSNSYNGPGYDGLLTSAPDMLHMFNVVFVLSRSLSAQLPLGNSSPTASSPSAAIDAPRRAAPSKHQQRTRELYVHCVKKLALALQIRQKKGGYVWDEVKKVIGVREKAREAGASYAATWPTLCNASSLARALATAFTGITNSSIAHLSLGSSVSISLQLPRQTDTPQVPTPTAPNPPPPSALWLTTFSPFPVDGESNTSGGNTPASASITPASALLLLVPAETLLKEISASPTSPLAAPLTYYIRHTLPTKTLSQFARKSRLSLPNIQLLSLHLIYWRRARAIPPLHHTNTYIVSPLADWSTFEDACAVFRARFPALPGLPNILARLSAPSPTAKGGPQPWGRLMPTADHKEAYMAILEWLVRGGWVTQLRTFAWVVVSAEVKAAVARKMRKEEEDAAAAAAVEETLLEIVDTVDELGGGSGHYDSSNNNNGAAVAAPAVGAESSKGRRKSSQGSSSVLSPRLKPRLHVPRRDSEAGSVSSVSTALRVPLRSGLRVESPASMPRRKSSEHMHRLSDGSSNPPKPTGATGDTVSASDVSAAAAEPDVDASSFELSIVTSPHKANALESRWLEHIGEMQDTDVRELWPRLLNYFDGCHAVEEIATREGMKRKVLNPVLAKLMGDGGVLRTVRHW